MIVDAYNNTWVVENSSSFLGGDEFGVDRLIEVMDAGGVDMAMATSLGQLPDNDYIADCVRRYPDRIFGFSVVDPRRPDAVDEVHRTAELGLVGVKLHPTMHGYHVCDHGLLDPVFRACADTGQAVLFNALDDAFCAPLGMEEIARGFPEVPTLIAHMGTVWNTNEAILVAGRTPNIYLETSSTQLLEVRTAYDQLGPDRLVMGTDWPASHMDLERMKIARAIPDADDRAKVEGANLSALLGLSVGSDA
jgi:uncharacterized protein